MGGRLTVALLAAGVAVALAVAGSPRGAVAAAPAVHDPTAPETVLLLRRPVSLARVYDAVLAAGARPVYFAHYGVTARKRAGRKKRPGGMRRRGARRLQRGSYGNRATGLPLELMIRDYFRLHRAAGFRGQPRVFAMRVLGTVNAEALGPLARLVGARRVVDGSTRTALAGPAEQRRIDRGRATSERAEVGKIAVLPRTAQDEETTAAVDKKIAADPNFAPRFGRIRTRDLGLVSEPREIYMTLTWTTAAQLAQFERNNGLDNAYEHDLKMIEPSHSGRPHPLCFGEGDDFWIDTDGRYSTYNFPESSRPYDDYMLGDSCETNDWTVGVIFPLDLVAGQEYRITWRSRRGTDPSSEFYLSAQAVPRSCPAAAARCVGLFERNGPMPNIGDEARIQELVGERSVHRDDSLRNAPGCADWSVDDFNNGSASRC